MNPEVAAWGPRRRPVPWIAGTLVLAGFLLPARQGHWSWWAILLTGLGTFGPGLLRELGWLKDKDEFQLQAARRAGYHAFLATGLVAFLWIAFFRSGPREVGHAEELAPFFAALLWFTWMLSALVSYWGARTTAFRLLMLYGLAWLLFNVASHATRPRVLALQAVVTIPFFLGAWASRRWPRTTGVLLLGLACLGGLGLGRLHQRRGFPPATSATTLLLFVGPLLASGLALQAGREEAAREATP